MDKPHIYGLAALWGAIIWGIIVVIGGRSEAWDSPLYFIAGLPLLCAGAVVSGWMSPDHAARPAIWMAAGHAGAIFAGGMIAGQGLGLLPFTIILILTLNIPLMLLSVVGGFMRRKLKPGMD